MQRRYRRYCLAALLAVVLLVTLAPAAQAHGEAAQEAFLRMRTVGWVNVRFSSDTVMQGETFTITGVAKIMESWPTNLAKGNPNTGYLGLVAPGPVVMLKERTMNGVSVPSRIDIKKGDIFEFSMTVAGRRVGRWHVHPSFSVKGAGTLLGPGMWINVRENPDGFKNEVTLVEAGGGPGDTINLENYQLPYVWIWLILTFVIGFAWMWYWTVPKRTVTNLAVTSQIPLNTDGGEYGLITKRDHRNVNIFLLVTILLLVVGWIYQANAFPTKIPQQIIQFAPPQSALAENAGIAETRNARATFDPATDTVSVSADVTNTGTTPLTLTAFHSSTLAYTAGTAAGPGVAVVTPQAEVAPGATTKLTLTAKDPAWRTEHLLPVGESQLLITGILVFRTGDGNTALAEMEAILQPRFE
jgi:methane/ammonia monooxygenase subunit B